MNNDDCDKNINVLTANVYLSVMSFLDNEWIKAKEVVLR